MNLFQAFKSITKVTETKKIISVNISWLLLQNAVKLVFGLTVSLYLAKYLGPEDFGVYSFGISLLSLFLLFTDLGVNPILIRELVDNKINSMVLMGSSFKLKIYGGILGFILMTLLGFYYGFDSKTGIVILLMSPILLIRSLNVLDSYFQSLKENKFPVIANITSIVVGSILIFLFVNLKFNVQSFAIIYTFECAVLFSALIILYLKKNLTLKWKSENSVSINILRESWPIIIISVASIINARIDQVYIGSMLSSSVLGNFSAAAKVAEFWLVLPVIIHTVLYPILIDLRSINFNKYKRLIYLIISASFLFGVLFSGLITSFSKEIILILFGNKYNIAGEYLALYIWSTLPIFSLYIVGSVIYLENLIKKNLIVSSVSILANLILNYFFIQFYGANGAIYATLIVTLISYSLIGYFIYNHTKLLR
jgi:O-antigen/teichoic acid export membrane protein